jgi:hypothetical protein
MNQADCHQPASRAQGAARDTEKTSRKRHKAGGHYITAGATPDVEPGATIGLRSIAPDDRVTDVMSAARREHLIIVTNGQRFAMCSVIPAGWRPFGAHEFENTAY